MGNDFNEDQMVQRQLAKVILGMGAWEKSSLVCSGKLLATFRMSIRSNDDNADTEKTAEMILRKAFQYTVELVEVMEPLPDTMG